MLACEVAPLTPPEIEQTPEEVEPEPIKTIPIDKPKTPGKAFRRAPPAGWASLTELIPEIKVDIRYHTPDNFTGAPLPGYGVASAWLLEEPARSLKQVQEDLAEIGHGLLVYDAYRPLRGTQAMVAWAKRTRQVHLLDTGYIARRSGHNKGNTIDLTIINLETGDPIDMGTPWDTQDERSHTLNAEGVVYDNRIVLKAKMEARGWKNYWKEWWHFSYALEGADDLPHRDVPYACSEAEEGEWKEPQGWSTPGFTMPKRIPVTPCQDTK